MLCTRKPPIKSHSQRWFVCFGNLFIIIIKHQKETHHLSSLKTHTQAISDEPRPCTAALLLTYFQGLPGLGRDFSDSELPGNRGSSLLGRAVRSCWLLLQEDPEDCLRQRRTEHQPKRQTKRPTSIPAKERLYPLPTHNCLCLEKRSFVLWFSPSFAESQEAPSAAFSSFPDFSRINEEPLDPNRKSLSVGHGS